MKIKLCLGQLAASERKADNLKNGVRMVGLAADAGANLLVLPEFFMAYIPYTAPKERFLS